LSNAAAKIAEYYDKIATSDDSIFAMHGLSLITFSVLHPQKMKHFKKHWSTDLQVKLSDVEEEVVNLLLSLHHEIWNQSMTYSSNNVIRKLTVT